MYKNFCKIVFQVYTRKNIFKLREQNESQIRVYF